MLFTYIIMLHIDDDDTMSWMDDHNPADYDAAGTFYYFMLCMLCYNFVYIFMYVML
jgi:hypothetical protein